jgi:hypothetical protein
MAAKARALLPGFVIRRLPRFLLWFFAISSVPLFALLFGHLSGFPTWIRLGGWILYAVGLPLLIYRFISPMPKALARVRRGELPCWYCGYDVRQCAEPRCPECGHDLNAQDLQAKWGEAITRASRPRR